MTAAAPKLRPVPQPDAGIVIDKGIPIPPMRNGANKYPLADMEVGDSFLVPYKPDRSREQAQRLLTTYARAWRNRRGNGWKFTTRREAGGVRIWRTA